MVRDAVRIAGLGVAEKHESVGVLCVHMISVP
jgi:hypothetical protein